MVEVQPIKLYNDSIKNSGWVISLLAVRGINHKYIVTGRCQFMTMADRIQSLRKSKGISQEELADRIGVSRQAVSKWESEQSSPDLEKVILLSDYFEVTTDYLLRGIEPKEESGEKCGQGRDRQDARIYAAGGTSINVIGLVTAVMVWLEEQSQGSGAIGVIFFAIGCLIYAIGQFVGEKKEPARKWFIAVNAWIILLIPASCIFNMIQGMAGGHWWAVSPLPQWGHSFAAMGMFWLCYIGVCIFIDALVLAKDRKTKDVL